MSKFIDKIKLPTEIAENETGFYHVVIVEASFNQAQLEATYKARTQTYDRRSWLAVKDNLNKIGHTNVYVIHDPTLKVETETDNGGGDQDPKGTNAGGGDNAGAGDNGDDKGADDNKDGDDDKLSRSELIEKAKSLGWTGALNAKNVVYEEFIKNAETNGENADGDGGE